IGISRETQSSIRIVPDGLAAWGERGRLLPLYPNTIFLVFANYFAAERSLPAGLEKILFPKITHLRIEELKREKEPIGLAPLREARKQNKRKSLMQSANNINH